MKRILVEVLERVLKVLFIKFNGYSNWIEWKVVEVI